MKTPIQELIETFKEIQKDQDPFSVHDAIEFAEAMLKKEKKVMEDCFDSANLIIEESIDGDHKWGTFREYYNETFNTKES